MVYLHSSGFTDKLTNLQYTLLQDGLFTKMHHIIDVGIAAHRISF